MFHLALQMTGYDFSFDLCVYRLHDCYNKQVQGLALSWMKNLKKLLPVRNLR